MARLMDRDACIHAMVKVGLDAVGVQHVASETDAMRRFAPLLTPPLEGPRIINASEGLLVMEPVLWLPRSSPWHLAEDVASAVGRFHKAGGPGSTDGRGLGHGDFAPWNIVRTENRWVLLDWEEAESDASPFMDPLHHLVQAHALLGRPTRREIIGGLSGRGWVGRTLGAYAEAAELSMSTSRDVLAEYLVSSRANLRRERLDGLRGLRARRRLLADLERIWPRESEPRS